ncbi:bifunctional diaminohydroxyphosphoribosylaminopyrimidine deaminase/5-amino-6-(5-phosphoribosylamino)uracil reductase RibD [Parvularcula sp. ZS-1/3]|uniref:Riboflavin biosynthesis protein RibD n=1 Tax=Parvularcula mediterranea TaxID=2732508 RepID=A0A7Y3RL17_9PROT|nr:bifunctional diaminohydroxyphosphoribosylaminopyrimidine deaminase/5-amino-6-(5-phosphoribosylamino)uracil reductase RibD [Parvularcula mediterranea]NNU16052.1 bifunctional diaminohydroxyphosphoribosylaminopyrimidine deaminase/5-amino-6-(5-phosphoribosylamino)uracil reductase RibD [Parvularcula mediterranea]
MQDAQHIERAIALARNAEGFTHPNPMVGCVLVKDGAVVAEGWHKGPGQEHAEAMALRLAGDAARGAVAYVTLEPCNHHGRTPPCSEALIAAGVAGVVYGLRDVNPLAVGGAERLREAGIPTRLAEGRVRTACAELVRPWVHTLKCWRPWVTAKLAMSLDGFTATTSGESKWITGPEARQRGHDLRQRTGAIIVGVGTVLADNPSLDPRPEGREPAPSLKVVLDSELRTPIDAKLLTTPGVTLIVGHEDADSSRASALEDAGAEVVLLLGEGRPDIKELLRLLKERGQNDVMIESGGTLLGAAFDADVIDEVWAFTAPMILGAGRPAIASKGRTSLANALRLEKTEIEKLGQDTLLRGLKKRSAH